jgi:hypothetical protein
MAIVQATHGRNKPDGLSAAFSFLGVAGHFFGAFNNSHNGKKREIAQSRMAKVTAITFNQRFLVSASLSTTFPLVLIF